MKCVITIEDISGGKVKVVSDPSFEVMMKMNESGHELTSAHGYLFAALNAIREAAKKNRLSVDVPRLIS